MELKDWCKAEPGRASRLSKAVGIKPSFLSQIVSGKRAMPPSYVQAVEAATAGEVTRQEMRPKDWSAIWPEPTKRRVSKVTPSSRPAEEQAEAVAER